MVWGAIMVKWVAEVLFKGVLQLVKVALGVNLMMPTKAAGAHVLGNDVRPDTTRGVSLTGLAALVRTVGLYTGAGTDGS